MNCELCAHADTHGSWNQQGTHCRDCHRTWTSKSEAHCVRCHHHFSSHTAADLHDPYCTPDTETTRKRLISARRGGGKPVLAVRDRKHGSVFVSWTPDDGDKPW